MTVPAPEVFCYWPADRAIEETAIGLLDPGAPLPAPLQAVYQESFIAERAFAGLPPAALPTTAGDLRQALHDTGEAVYQSLGAAEAPWDLVAQFVRRRALLFPCLHRAAKKPPLVISYAAAATTPAGNWPAGLAVGGLFPLFAVSHAATLADVAAHTNAMLRELRAADLTKRQAYRGISFHHTLWYSAWHGLHHITQAERYEESHQLR